MSAPNGSIGDRTPADRIVAWTIERFGGERVVLTTGFGPEGCVLVDLYGRLGAAIRVVYVDTGFLFPETYRLRDRLAKRYPHLRFQRVATELTPIAQAVVFGAALWRRDPDRCCTLRKVEPLRPALRRAGAWIAGITRHQGGARGRATLIGWDRTFETVKVCPLVNWDRQRVWTHIREHDVPYNVLHERGYPSIGCIQCTARVPDVPRDGYSRVGRWAGHGKTECGLHGDPPAGGTVDG